MIGTQSKSAVQRYYLPLAILMGGLLLAGLCLGFEPHWETNDDVAISMAAHGYGAFAKGSPNILFSNVLWGYLVRAMPEPGGLSGYAVATLLSIFSAVTAIAYAILSVRRSVVVCALVLILIFARPILFPQFTINAGLLTVGGIALLMAYIVDGGPAKLVFACLLAYAGFLVRSSEFLLVALIALPLAPWRQIIFQWPLRLSALALIVATVGSAVVDHYAYSGPQWSQFFDFDPVRTQITDFGAGLVLRDHPALLASFAYSANDINLLRSWFFADPTIANPASLRSMLAQLPPPLFRLDWQGGWAALQTFGDVKLLPLVAAAILLAAFRPRLNLTIAWGVCLAVFFLLGAFGRPGIFRVYFAPVDLLLIFAVFSSRVPLQRVLVPVIGAAAAVWNLVFLVPESLATRQADEKIRQSFASFPVQPVVAWGAAFPYEALYPVLARRADFPKFRLDGLGVSFLDPYTVAAVQTAYGSGIVKRLSTADGILVYGGAGVFKLLDTYCREHMNGELHQLSTSKRYGAVVLKRVTCAGI